MKYLKFLVSPLFMGLLFIIFAVAMAAATFIENDFGSPAAYSMIYDTRWFELILLLLALNLVGQLIIYKLFRRARITMFLFHLSFIVMIAGAAITRYFGWEGTMHIREGEEQKECYSNEKYIGLSVKDEKENVLYSLLKKYTMTSATAENFKRKLNAGGKEYEVLLARIIPNAAEALTENPGGEPAISLIVTRDMTDQERIIIRKGESKSSNGISLGFESGDTADLNIKVDSGRFYVISKQSLGVMSMMTHSVIHSGEGKPIALKKMQILTLDDIKIVIQEMSLSATVKAVSLNPDNQKTGQNAFIFHIFSGKESAVVSLWDRNTGKSESATTKLDGKTFEISYGPKLTLLPFGIRLNDFVLEKYPGSNSPSGYKSNVVLLDKANGIEKPYLIFMNNILKYKGYRFYQSSFDHDEKGTILSVNHDMAGMIVTYSGYTLLFIFIVMSLLNKNSVFRNIKAGNWQSSLRKAVPAVVIILFLSGFQDLNAGRLIPDKAASDEMGKLLVQDQKGRTKPLFTLSNDILRKVTRKSSFEGLNSMQVFLGLYLDFENWKDVPLISVSSRDLRTKLAIRGKYAAFTDFVSLDHGGTYKISEQVNNAYSKAPGERNKMDKELMKIDERINIVYMIYQGEFMKLFPLRNGTSDWGPAEDALQKATGREDSLYLQNIVPALRKAIMESNLTNVKQATRSINEYQTRFTDYNLPGGLKTRAELLYYRMSIFERLFPFYATLGLVMLTSLIIMVISGKRESSMFGKITGSLLLAGFLFHTFGLGLRWYIAGHSPMSNGYESMIFISWMTLLAGFIFSRKSSFALSATAILASMTLMVAHLSFMDPEITNLVPVLKSYWLTLHVSVITGSYGFLGLGALLGLITLILMALLNKNNSGRISATIDELTVINYRTLTIGLYLLTIGTFLGAVWANESWGRYWGWDPKETWSLITIIVYSLVVHSRMIPGMKDIYTFNLISLFAFSSVLMTYFGVNYYLSGLHSYAGGDPVPVPVFVYFTVVILVALALVAYFRYAGFKRPEEKGSVTKS
jgi:cytochrome c-type biogenesis protein CcsB